MSSYSVKVTATQADVKIDLLNGGTLVKTVTKQYSSVQALVGVISRWRRDAVLPKVLYPTGLFGSSLPNVEAHLQEYIQRAFAQLGEDNFELKQFFRLYDLREKVVIITGASSGIGKQNAIQFAEMGAHVILACRTEAKTRPIIDDIKQRSGNPNVEFAQLDLASLASVRAFVENFKARNLPLHVLLNNAGGIVEGLTEYGVDLTYGAYHVSPFLLSVSLLEVLKRTPGSRLIFVSSDAATRTNSLPWPRIKSKIPLGITTAMEAYGYAKLSNIIVCKVLARQSAEERAGVITNVLHPGVVATPIWDRLPAFIASPLKAILCINEEEGSLMSLYLSIGERAAEYNGQFFDYYAGPAPRVPQIPLSEDAELQRQVWDESEKMAGLKA